MSWAFWSARGPRSERDDGMAADADAGRFVIDPDALRPALGGVAAWGGVDEEAQSEATTSVAVAAWGLDVRGEGAGERVGSFHGRFHSLHLWSHPGKP